MRKDSDTKKGFTIIEVSLVLAIAGLIFLMVFVALPSLQRMSRDTQRREDIAKLSSAIKKFQTNNRGVLPSGSETTYEYHSNSTGTTWAGFYTKYLGENFADPTGGRYKLYVTKCTGNTGDCTNPKLRELADKSFLTSGVDAYKIYIILQASCNGDKAAVAENPRKLAILYRLEGSGVYCSEM